MDREFDIKDTNESQARDCLVVTSVPFVSSIDFEPLGKKTTEDTIGERPPLGKIDLWSDFHIKPNKARELVPEEDIADTSLIDRQALYDVWAQHIISKADDFVLWHYINKTVKGMEYSSFLTDEVKASIQEKEARRLIDEIELDHLAEKIDIEISGGEPEELSQTHHETMVGDIMKIILKELKMNRLIAS